MQLDVRQAGIPQLTGAVEDLTREVVALLAPLSPAQLNWKPNAEEWSLGQCLDHVMVANGTYFAPLEQLLAGKKATTFWERLPGLPGLFGPMLIRGLQPESTQKVPTIKAFAPTSSAVAPDILGRFEHQQTRLVELMSACAGLDVERVIITSPAAAFVTYSLLDAFRIIVVHEQHHLAQTIRIMALDGFPT
jgi:DinB superfamily